jgi:hypothetical protein
VARFEDLEYRIAVEDPWVWHFLCASYLSYVGFFFFDAYPFDATITSENVVITILNICFYLYECLSGLIVWVTVDI